MKTVEYEIAAASMIGTRKEQQDAYHYEQKKEECFAVVCDGMGGMAQGARASTIAVETIKQLYSMKKETESYDVFFLNALDILDESVYAIRKSKKEETISGTTIVSIALDKDKLFWLSVGDSRLYLQRGKEIICVTRDHNYFLILDEALKKGDISQDLYQSEKKRGESLISYIGMGGIELIDRNTTPVFLCNNDILLLVSDGVYRYLSQEQIKSNLMENRNSEEMVKRLLECSKKCANKGQDNATAVIIKVKIQEEDKNEVSKM